MFTLTSLSPRALSFSGVLLALYLLFACFPERPKEHVEKAYYRLAVVASLSIISLLINVVLLVYLVLFLFVGVEMTWIGWAVGFILLITVFLTLFSARAVVRQEANASLYHPDQGVGSKSDAEGKTSSYWLPEDQAWEIRRKVDRFLIEEKRFLEQGFCQDGLAEGVGVHRHHLSACFTQAYTANFNEIINKRRIEYGIKKVKPDDWERYTVEGIGHHLGFGSRTTFTNAFKKVTGMTSNKYRNALYEAGNR